MMPFTVQSQIMGSVLNELKPTCLTCIVGLLLICFRISFMISCFKFTFYMIIFHIRNQLFRYGIAPACEKMKVCSFIGKLFFTTMEVLHTNRLTKIRFERDFKDTSIPKVMLIT